MPVPLPRRYRWRASAAISVLDWASFPSSRERLFQCDAELSARLRKRLAEGVPSIGVSWSSRNPPLRNA